MILSKARRAKARVLYNGRDISDYITDFSYTDSTDKTDDIAVTLSDREERWAKDWFPETGDRAECSIEVCDWEYDGDNRELSLGSFEVDNVTFKDVVTMNAVAAPISSSVRSEKKSRAWKEINLNAIAGDIAGTAGLLLVYETEIDPFYDKRDQNNKSDLEFLEELCKSDGLCMKVTDSKLIIFDESAYDAKPPVLTIKRASTDVIGFPTFKRNAKNIYADCEISYFDAKTDRNHVGYFKAPDVGDVGHTLKLREDFNSEKDDADFDRKAKARLREQNRKEWTGDLTIKGDIIYFSGTNILFEGWHKFDGKYNIKSCTHKISGSGYTVTLNLFRCLEGY